MTSDPQPMPMVAKVLFVLISAVMIGVGLTAIITEFSPERSTRNGMVGPLYGTDAQLFGVTVALFGLMPLGALFKRPKAAAAWATIAGLAALLSLIWGLAIQ